jgi:excisionase family DNA binding protein
MSTRPISVEADAWLRNHQADKAQEEPSEAATPIDPLKPRLLSIRETGAVLGVGRSTVYDLISQGAIRTVKIGRRALVPIEDLDAYLKRLLASSPTL